MIDWLMLIKEQIAEGGYNFFFDFKVDQDGEISLSFWISNGFENIYEENEIFNACSYQTNRKGAVDQVTRMLGFIQHYKEEPTHE